MKLDVIDKGRFQMEGESWAMLLPNKKKMTQPKNRFSMAMMQNCLTKRPFDLR